MRLAAKPPTTEPVIMLMTIHSNETMFLSNKVTIMATNIAIDETKLPFLAVLG